MFNFNLKLANFHAFYAKSLKKIKPILFLSNNVFKKPYENYLKFDINLHKS